MTSPRIRPRRLAPLLALAVVALATAAAPALAGTIDVTTTADGGAGSLRDVLAAAVSGDVVHVPGGTYLLSGGGLLVPTGVTVAGDGARTTTVSGNGVSRVFDTEGAGVVLQDLTITGGMATFGAGVVSNSGLTLHRVAVVDNVATGNGGGGGLFVRGAQPLLIDHSLIARNRATFDSGGGISLETSASDNAIVASTITANTAVVVGGGILLNRASLLLDGDTLVGNAGTQQGGNLRTSGGMVTMRDTVFAGGVAILGGNCLFGPGTVVVSLGHNAQDTDSTPDPNCLTALSDPTDRAGLVLQLGPLADNGGPTDTLLPVAGSPLLDSGDTANCSATDQRGVPRPQGSACDVGAVERTSPALGSAFADEITPTSATLHATADTFGGGAGARFAYGPTSAYGAFADALGLPLALGAQGTSARLTGLTPATTYHFQLLVTTLDGGVAGADQTFTTASAGSTPLPPPPVGVRCVVPRLTGRRLVGARRLLTRAHCKLGMVKRPRARLGARRVVLVVRKQSRRAGARLAAGTHVGVTLGPKPAKRRRR